MYRTSSAYTVAPTIDPINNSVKRITVLTWAEFAQLYKRTFDSNRNMIPVTYQDQGNSNYGAVRPFQINVGSPDTVSNPKMLYSFKLCYR